VTGAAALGVGSGWVGVGLVVRLGDGEGREARRGGEGIKGGDEDEH
jgi:hypothetical protein